MPYGIQAPDWLKNAQTISNPFAGWGGLGSTSNTPRFGAFQAPSYMNTGGYGYNAFGGGNTSPMQGNPLDAWDFKSVGTTPKAPTTNTPTAPTTPDNPYNIGQGQDSSLLREKAQKEYDAFMARKGYNDWAFEIDPSLITVEDFMPNYRLAF